TGVQTCALPISQQNDLLASGIDYGRFEPMLGWAAVEDQGDFVAEIGLDVLRRRWADVTRDVGRRGRHWNSGCLEQCLSDWMRGHPDGDGIEAGAHKLRNVGISTPR